MSSSPVDPHPIDDAVAVTLEPLDAVDGAHHDVAEVGLVDEHVAP
jgi:hypothetical protein